MLFEILSTLSWVKLRSMLVICTTDESSNPTWLKLRAYRFYKALTFWKRNVIESTVSLFLEKSSDLMCLSVTSDSINLWTLCCGCSVASMPQRARSSIALKL